jgi:hypothetical protein
MKRLNTDSITNELVHSSFFPGRPADRPEKDTPKAPAPQPAPVRRLQPIAIPPVTKPEPSRPATMTKPVPAAAPAAAPAGRRYVRRTFDFYEDQVTYLLEESLRDRLAGKEGSMNAMVREAIDAFIAARKNK